MKHREEIQSFARGLLAISHTHTHSYVLYVFIGMLYVRARGDLNVLIDIDYSTRLYMRDINAAHDVPCAATKICDKILYVLYVLIWLI